MIELGSDRPSRDSVVEKFLFFLFGGYIMGYIVSEKNMEIQPQARADNICSRFLNFFLMAQKTQAASKKND